MKRMNEYEGGALSTAGSPTPGDVRKHDTLSRKGASELARQLQGYWHGQGYPLARFWSEPITIRMGKLGTHEIHRVVCNLVDGLPPR
jgi:hypothetical protein